MSTTEGSRSEPSSPNASGWETIEDEPQTSRSLPELELSGMLSDPLSRPILRREPMNPKPASHNTCCLHILDELKDESAVCWSSLLEVPRGFRDHRTIVQCVPYNLVSYSIPVVPCFMILRLLQRTLHERVNDIRSREIHTYLIPRDLGIPKLTDLKTFDLKHLWRFLFFDREPTDDEFKSFFGEVVNLQRTAGYPLGCISVLFDMFNMVQERFASSIKDMYKWSVRVQSKLMRLSYSMAYFSSCLSAWENEVCNRLTTSFNRLTQAWRRGMQGIPLEPVKHFPQVCWTDIRLTLCMALGVSVSDLPRHIIRYERGASSYLSLRNLHEVFFGSSIVDECFHRVLTRRDTMCEGNPDGKCNCLIFMPDTAFGMVDFACKHIEMKMPIRVWDTPWYSWASMLSVFCSSPEYMGVCLDRMPCFERFYDRDFSEHVSLYDIGGRFSSFSRSYGPVRRSPRFRRPETKNAMAQRNESLCDHVVACGELPDEIPPIPEEPQNPYTREESSAADPTEEVVYETQ